MLVMREEQMVIFMRQAQRQFAAALCELLQDTMIARRRIRRAEDAFEFVEAAVAAARSFPLTSNWAIANYVGLACRFGAGFAMHPLVAHILVPGSDAGDMQVQRLFEELSEMDWWHVRRWSDRNQDAI